MLVFSDKEQKYNCNGFELKYILKNRKYDTNHLIIVFSGFGAKSQFTYDFRKALETSRSYVLWIKDDFYNNNNATYYLDPITDSSDTLENSIASFLEDTLEFLQIRKENCTLLGCSKGGAAALYYGLKYNYKNIIASAPPLKVGSSVAGIIPKSTIKTPAKFMLGEKLTTENIEKMDNKILNTIEYDNIFDKNIYLISSNGDPRFEGQIKPYLHLFNKYYNFNFIESASVLVRSHPDVTSYNAPLILGLLNLLTFNLVPICKNSVIKGDEKNKEYQPNKETIYKLNELYFDENGNIMIEGIFFIRGYECAEYNDLKYSLNFINHLNINNKFSFLLAKGNNPNISKDYYEGKFFNYDKALFCTKARKGLNIEEITYGSYKISITIDMKCGISKEVYLKTNKKIHLEYKNEKYLTILKNDDYGNIIFEKK